MQKSPTTEKDVVGIPEESYSDARYLATLDYKTRYYNKNHKKDVVTPTPKFQVGEQVVCIKRNITKIRYYYLVEVIDFVKEGRLDDGFQYYGILKGTTDIDTSRVGRIVMFGETSNTWSQTLTPANIPPNSIVW